MSNDLSIPTKPLSEMVVINNGIDYKKNPKGNEEIPIYGTGGIMGYTSIALNEGPAVLTGRKGSINRPFYLEGKFWNVDTIFCLKPIGANNAKWLYYSILNVDMTKLNEATGVPSITSKSLYRLKINYFEPDKQQKIAHILTNCDTVIEQTQSAIAKYIAIKQGLLHDLFTRGLDANGHLRPSYQNAPELYKESELGMIPKDWEVKRLEELTEKIGSGVTPTGGSEVYQTSGVLFIRSQNVLIGSLTIKDAAFITKEIDEKMEGSRVKPYDVFLNITGASIGRSAYFPVELKSANVNQHVCIIRFKGISKSLAIYASEFLNSNFGQTQIYKSIAGGNREGLNFQQIKSFSFPSISPSEIEKIAKIIELQSNKIQTEETLLQKYQSIKRGLMGDLLGGKKEVKIEE